MTDNARTLTDEEMGFGQGAGTKTPAANIKTLSDAEMGFDPPARGLKGWGQDIAATALKGAIAVPEAIVGLADIPTGGRVGKFLENEGGAVGFRPKEAKEIVNDWHSDATKEAQRKFQEADGIWDKTVAAIQNPSNIAVAIGESLPSMGAGGVAARGLMAATKLGQMGAKGAAAAGALGEGVMGGGSAAEQIRQETKYGLLTPEQAAYAAATGVATSVFGYAGGRVAQKLGIGDAETMMAQGIKGMNEQAAAKAGAAAINPMVADKAVKGIPRKVIEGAISEGFLEELPQSMSEQILQNLALDKPWHDQLDSAAVMGVLSGGAMGAGAAGFHGFRESGAKPAGQPAAPGEVPADNAAPQASEPLQLGYNPDPLIVFPDGTVGTRAQVDAYIDSLPENERIAARAKLLNAGPEAVQQPQPSPGMRSVRMAALARLREIQQQEMGGPDVPQTEAPDGAAALAQQQAVRDAQAAQAQAERDALQAQHRAIEGPDDEILQSTGAAVRPSEAMGLRTGPAAGALENAAAMAVDTGATGQMQQAAALAQAAEDAKKAKPNNQKQEQLALANTSIDQDTGEISGAPELASWTDAQVEAQYHGAQAPEVRSQMANELRRRRDLQEQNALNAELQDEMAAIDMPDPPDGGFARVQEDAGAVPKNIQIHGEQQSQATVPGSQAKGANVATLAQLNRKQLPDMSDAELQQLASLLPADHQRQGKIEKELMARSQSAPVAINTGANQNGTQTNQAQQSSAQPAQAARAQAGAGARANPASVGTSEASAGAGQDDGAVQPTAGGRSNVSAQREQGLTNGAAATENNGRQANTTPAPQAAAPTDERQARAQRIADAGAQWTRMPAAERSALVAQLEGVKPVIAKNMPGAQWANLNGDIQRKLADAMGLSTQTEPTDAGADKADMQAIIENVRRQDSEAAAKVARDMADGEKRSGNIVVKDGNVYQLQFMPRHENGRRPIDPEHIHVDYPDSNMILALGRGIPMEAPYAQTLIRQAKDAGFEVEGEHWSEAAGEASAETFVKAPGGGVDFGEITPDMGKVMRRQAGKIRLRQGTDAWGLLHIKNRHEAQIKARGFATVEEFVQRVASNFDAVYQRSGSAIDVVLSDGRGKLIVQLELNADGDYYDIKTATPIRASQYKNKEPLWERAGPSTPTAETAAPLNPRGQSGEASINASQNEGNADDQPSRAAAINDFPIKEAEQSYSGISHSGRQRAAYDQQAFEAFMERAQAAGQALAETDAQRDALVVAMDQLRADYLQQYRSLMNVRAGTYSGFVAGRGNLNSKQVNARNSALDKAMERFDSWAGENVGRVSKAVLAARTPEQVKADQDKRAASIKEQADKKAANLKAQLVKFLNFKRGEEMPYGKSAIITKVSYDRDGYPSSLTFKMADGAPVTDNKLDLVDALKDKGESLAQAKERIRALVDEVRAENPELTKGAGAIRSAASSKAAQDKEKIAKVSAEYLNGAVKGDTITASADFEYVTGGKPMLIESISPKGEVHVFDPVGGGRTSFKADMAAARRVTFELEKPAPKAAPAAEASHLDRHNAIEEAISAGTLELPAYKEAFASLEADRDAVMAELNKLTKDELLRAGGSMFAYRMRDEKKASIVQAAYQQMLNTYALGRDYGPSSYFLSADSIAKNKADKAQALRDLVANTTADDLAARAAEIKAARDEFKAEREAKAKALAEPKTLEDFRSFMRHWMEKGDTSEAAYVRLTPKQRQQFDALEAEQTKESRDAAKRRAQVAVASAGNTTAGEVIATKHTKHGHDLFVVKLAERVERGAYDTLNSSAKRLGGSYSSYRGNGAVPGFQFRTREAAEAFQKLVGGDTAQAQELANQRRDAFDDDKSQSAAERLRTMADALDERATEALGADRKVNTARRARFAASAEAAARTQQALAGTMRNIAQAIDSGAAKFLDGVRQRVQVEYLMGQLRTAKSNQLQAKYPDYGERMTRQGEPMDAETVDFAQFPRFEMFRSDLASLARQLLEIDGGKKMGAALEKLADDVTDAYTDWAKANLLRVSHFGNKAQGGFAEFASKDVAERAIKRSGLVGKAVVLQIKRGQNRVILSPGEAMQQGLWQGDGDKRIRLSMEFVEGLAQLGKRKGSKVLALPWQLESALENRQRLHRMGIQTPAEFRSALRELASLQQEMATPDRIKELERSMVGRAKDGLDFFPTSPAVVQSMLDAAEIAEGMAVLEPSAGMGHIADAIVEETGVWPDVVELSGDRRELLEAKGFHLAEVNDFLTMEPRRFFTYGDTFRAPDDVEGTMRGVGGMGSQRVRLEDAEGNRLGLYDRNELVGVAQNGTWSGYDRIIMNPPFSDGRDIQHVQHAYSLLRPGGRIVAIMGEGAFFHSNKRAEAFREWLDERGATNEKLPDGSFMDPSLPVNTGVAARMVVIDKPEGDHQLAPRPVEDAAPQSAGAQTDTPAFKRWFGDSKVVGEDGKPLVMYHGTSGNQDGDAFTFFDTFASNYGLMGMGGYFTSDASVASSYTEKGDGGTPTVYPVFLSIKNPLDMDAKADAKAWSKQFPDAESYHEGGETNESWYRAAEDALTDEGLPKWEGAEVMQNGLRAMGFDGITHIGGGRVKSDSVKHRVFITFEPEQTKSATGNNGNFDPNSLNIANYAGNAKRRPGSAQDKAVMQAIADGKGARDVLRLIANGSKDPFLRQVARMLLKAGITPNIEFGHIGTSKGKPIHGQYRGKSDTIAIAGSAEYAAERIFMHEAMHAATMRALAKPGLHKLQLQKLLAHVRKQKGAAGFYGTTNVDEFVAEVFTNPEFQKALRTMSAPAGGTVKSAWDGFVRILRSILGLPNDSTNALSQALELGVAAMRQDMALRKQGVGTDRAANFGADDFTKLKTSALDQISQSLSHPGKVSLWDKTVGTMRNLGERVPQFKPVFEAAQRFIDDVSMLANDAADAAPRLMPRVESMADLKKKPITAADNKAVAKPLFEGTLMWARDLDGTPVTTDALNAKYSNTTADEKAQIMLRAGKLDDRVLKRLKAMPVDQYEKAINEKFESTLLKPGVVWSAKELKTLFGANDQQVSLYQEARAAIDRSLDVTARTDMLRLMGEDFAGMREAVLQAPDLDSAFELVVGTLQEEARANPDMSDRLMQINNEVVKRKETAQGLMDAGYAPLSRFGQYTLDVVDQDGERQYFGLFESKREANQMAMKMRDVFKGATVTQGTMSQEAFKLFQGITPESLEQFGHMLGLNGDGDEAKDKAFQAYLQLAKNNHSALKRLIHRKGIDGYSEDVGRVLASFVYSNARLGAGGLNAGTMEKAVEGIPKEMGELRDVAMGLRSYIQDPQEEGQAIRGMLFAQYLGGSVASAMVNMTQPFQITMPWLSQYGGMAKAGKQMARALKDMATKGYNYEPDLAKALKEAEDDGTVSPQEIHQLMAQARGTGSLRSGDGTKMGDTRAAASNNWERVKVAWGQPFALAEQFNRRSTFIASYRVAKDQGMSNPAEFARKAVLETQFLYSKANKPKWARGAIGGTLFTFKTYSVSYLELMHRMWTQGGPEGKRAVGWAVAMLMLMSGAGGLPFLEDAEDLIDGAGQLMGYNVSAKQWRKQLLADTLGKEFGEFVDQGMSGLPGAPIDVSGRLGLGNLIPGTGLLLTKQNRERDLLEIAGPAGDLVARGFSGARKVLTGDLGGAALEAAPTAVRNAAKGIDMATSGIYKDTKGYKVIDTTLAEAAAKFTGFQPKSVSEVQESNSFMQRSKSFYIQTSSEIKAQWADAIFNKDDAALERVRDRLDAWNRNNPDQPIVVKIPDVMKRVREMGKDRTQRIADTAPKALRAQMREMAHDASR